MSLLDELKRRRVVRAAILYGAVGYATIEVADVLVPALLLPPWTVRLVVFLVLLGLPVVLVLAWMFDLTPAGVVVADDSSPETAPRLLTPATGIAALAFVGIGLAAGWLLGRSEVPAGGPAVSSPGAGDAPRKASVAVLPFEDLSTTGDQAYFSDGIAEEIIHVLARIPALDVSARTSSFAFRGRSLDARAIGDSLGVDAVLEGSVRKDGEHLRIMAQLIDVTDGFHLWSETYDRRMAGVFEVQEELAGAIAEALRVPLGLSSKAELVPHRMADAGAYERYLEARARFDARGAGVSAAVELLEAVVASDPTFAPAWALMAEAYAILVYYAGPDGAISPDWKLGVRSIRRAQEAAERALALDSLHAPAHAAMGTVARERLDWAASERHLRRAIELDSEYAEAHSNLGEILFALDRVDEAREHHLRAIELEPHTWIYRYNMGWLTYELNEETLEHLRVARAIAPELWHSTILLAFNYAALGRWTEAREVIDSSETLAPVFREGVVTVLEDMEASRRTGEGRGVLRSAPWSAPYYLLLYGDTAGAARHALEITARYPYYWGGILGGLPELHAYPDFREARQRRNLPVRDVPSASPGADPAHGGR